ncbi:hypothetical protein GCM10007304_17890 [Rhodococcoides trifolii]|uniref:DUF1508 domain-containing protein n=1 Tax=Rhodococcoides trifolii TaxID=908250 RepID=A0A917CZW3_9NOCA|nr:DUF1508 domain-containing protein [Rhodococcus trifolii]GGG04177.1 hypothetical protein GCM10007304_17890 [Rhodococcus trifolii]
MTAAEPVRLPTVRVYRDSIGEWRWQRRATNGRILSDSGEGYKNRADCINGMRAANGYNGYQLTTGEQ